MNAGFVAALLILLFLSIFSYLLFEKHIVSMKAVDHTHEVLHASKDMLARIAEAEAGQRGYILTGNEEFLEPFYVAIDRNNTLLAKLRRLTRDNPAQQKRCNHVQQLVKSKFDFIRRTIRLRRTGTMEEVLPLVESGEGKALMDELRGVFHKIDAEEQRLLQIRKEKTARTEMITKPLLVVGLVVSIAILIIIYRALHRQICIRIRREHELYESHEWFSKTLHSIGDGVIATDEHFAVSFMNPVAEKLTGWSEEEARGKPIDRVFNIINVFTRQKVDNPIVTAVNERRIVELADNTLLIRKDNTELHIDDSGSPIISDENEVIGAILTFRDVTESKRAEQELNMFFEISIDLAGIATTGGYFTRITPSVEKILGYTVSEFLSQSFMEFIHPDDIDSSLAELQRLSEGMPTVNFKNRYACKDGSYKWLEWNVSPREDKLYAVARDITDRQIAEEELMRLHNDLRDKNTEIVDSINYAKRIQNAIMPAASSLKELFPDSFVLNKPKDIVSGDFYWSCKTGRKSLVALADCTGHGVPGALLSIIGSQKLNEAVLLLDTDGAGILSYLNNSIKSALKQHNDNSSKDGMDIALCAVEYPPASEPWEPIRLTFTGANRPLWVIRKGKNEVEEIKATKRGIGGWTDRRQHFEDKDILLRKGDTFYLFSDGYADQFGGNKGKKLMSKRFRELLGSVQNLTMDEQRTYLEHYLERWKNGTDQIDDILVIGVRL
jgi:PAS domain S-box-containing protein